MSNGNFEHRLDALGRSLASGHDAPMPPALHEAIGTKAAALRARRVALAAILFMALVIVVLVHPRRGTKDEGAIPDDLESIRRAVAPVWREQVKESSSAAGASAKNQSQASTPRAGNRGRGAASPDGDK
ncbi:MAG: hypothetical protein IT434_01700 [Phycisphaerales bacterium]|jgi:hypothetical protein|nr:hypothetical protein [Phycisphaerales bacterium]